MKYFRIKNWEKYQHRDATRGEGPMQWIRLQTSIIYDEKTRELDTNSRLTWILLLAYSGQTRNKLPWSPRLLKSILGTARAPNLHLFEDIGLIEVFDASNLPAERQHDARPDNKTRQDNTIQDTLTREAAGAAGPTAPNLAELWNEYCGPLPKVHEIGTRRFIHWQGRWREIPSREYWVSVIQRMVASPFCRGESDSGWQATVDFMLRPDTHVKVLEGSYDAKAKQESSSLESNLQVFKSILGGGDVNAG